MKRFNKIKKEANADVNINQNSNGQININSNGSLYSNGLSESQQIAEEKAAAKLFPLNLISNRFKNAQPDFLKGIFLA